MPKLLVQDGARPFLVDLRPGETLRLGRDPDCEVCLRAGRASRRHAEIAAEAAGAVVRDLGSTNGTLVNGAALTGEVRLSDGDVLDLGGARVVFRSRP